MAQGVWMLVLIAIGFVAGLITSISPCILPVLPVVLAAGVRRQPTEAPVRTPTPATAPTRASPPTKYVITAPSKARARRLRDRSWRPYAVVAGLVISFSAATLFGAVVLSALHLSDNLLRDAGIVVLVIFGLGLIFRPVGELLERPFIRLTGRPVNQSSNGLVLGLGAGLLFVPCAGPVLATIAVVGATHRVGFSAVILTLAFGIGVAVPLLLLTLAGDAQNAASTCQEGGATPQSCGPAPELTGINAWLNTAGDKPLTLAGLRGKVVLIDFWTYSCINCQRTLPH